MLPGQLSEVYAKTGVRPDRLYDLSAGRLPERRGGGDGAPRRCARRARAPREQRRQAARTWSPRRWRGHPTGAGASDALVRLPSTTHAGSPSSTDRATGRSGGRPCPSSTVLGRKSSGRRCGECSPRNSHTVRMKAAVRPELCSQRREQSLWWDKPAQMRNPVTRVRDDTRAVGKPTRPSETRQGIEWLTNFAPKC